MSQQHYDFFVIGAGSAGVRFARMAAMAGKKVAIAEQYRSGGTCVIRGCVPKKLYAYASRFASDFEVAKTFGWNIQNPSFDWNILRDNKDTEITRLEGIYNNLLKNAGVDIFHERAILNTPTSILLTNSNQMMNANHIIIAVGGTPRPLMIGGVPVGMTSDEIFDIKDLPKKIFIYGSGYIAVEFACIFAELGVDVTLGFRGQGILTGFDGDIQTHITTEFLDKNIHLIPDLTLDKLSVDNGILHFNHQNKEYYFEHILNATGRSPNTKNLGLDKIGVQIDKNGAVIVDKFSKTTVDTVYAVGDVTNRMNLTPVAIKESMCLLQTLCHDNPTSPDYENIPTAVFTTPEIGTIGLTEQQAKIAGYQCDIYESRFRPMKYSFSEKTTKTYFKMIVEQKTQIVLGVHIIDNFAGELIQLVGIAVKSKLTKQQFDSVMAVHPTAAEELVTMRMPTRQI